MVKAIFKNQKEDLKIKLELYKDPRAIILKLVCLPNWCY